MSDGYEPRIDIVARLLEASEDRYFYTKIREMLVEAAEAIQLLRAANADTLRIATELDRLLFVLREIDESIATIRAKEEPR